MGERLEKLKRMQGAAQNDELPLVHVLKARGLNAGRNDTAGGLGNRVLGDVYLKVTKNTGFRRAKTLTYSFECQVVGSEKRYDSFSYGSDKVKLYRGAEYDLAYTLLGCYEKRGGEDMIFVLLPARKLHDFLLSLKPEDFGHGVFLNDGKPTKGKASSEYYTILPECLASLDGTIVGASIDEVANRWVDERRLGPKGKRS